MIERMASYPGDGGLLLLASYVIGFYCVIFVLRSLIKRRREFIVQGKLSIGNIVKAIGHGLLIPALVTFADVIGSVFIWAIQDPQGLESSGSWEYASFVQIFTGAVAFVQFLVILALVIVALYYTLRTIWRFLLRPAGRGIRWTYRAVRPFVPVRW